jgi:hypothetical protein
MRRHDRSIPHGSLEPRIRVRAAVRWTDFSPSEDECANRQMGCGSRSGTEAAHKADPKVCAMMLDKGCA